MKKLFLIAMVIPMTFGLCAQAPQKMSYQAVIRNSSGSLITNHPVGMKISVLLGSATGTVVYQEIYNPNPETNANGLVSIEIGGGLPITGTFSSINWSSGQYFLKTETDPTGGTNYTIVGTSQLLSVPYALHAGSAASYSESDPVFGVSPSHAITNGNISNWNTAFGWGNHAGLYRPVSWVPSWSDVTGKPSFAAVATSGSYSDLINKPSQAGVAHIEPTLFQSWATGEYQIKTLATLTMNIPASGWVLLIHTGYCVFGSQGREMFAGIGTSTTTMLNTVDLGYLDGSATLRYKLPYTVTTLVSVTAGSRTFYALGEGTSVFPAGGVNMVPSSFTGIFFPQ